MDYGFQEYSDPGEKRSLLSRSSETVSVLSESRGLFLENMDGTISHGVPVLYTKDHQKGPPPQFEGYVNNRIMYVADEDEIALYTGFYDLPTRVDDFLDMFLRHQRYFMGFLGVFFLIELSLIYMGYARTESAVNQLMSTYHTPARQALTEIYHTAIFTEIIYLVLYYPLGMLAVYKRSMKVYSYFATYSLLGLVYEMVLAYADRFLGFLYSRFLSQLLVSLLLLPR